VAVILGEGQGQSPNTEGGLVGGGEGKDLIIDTFTGGLGRGWHLSPKLAAWGKGVKGVAR